MLSILTRRLIQVQNISLLWEILLSLSNFCRSLFTQSLLTSTRFFATSWNQEQDIDPVAAKAIRYDYKSRLQLLSQVLPLPFQENPEYSPWWGSPCSLRNRTLLHLAMATSRCLFQNNTYSIVQCSLCWYSVSMDISNVMVKFTILYWPYNIVS